MVSSDVITNINYKIAHRTYYNIDNDDFSTYTKRTEKNEKKQYRHDVIFSHQYFSSQSLKQVQLALHACGDVS